MKKYTYLEANNTIWLAILAYYRTNLTQLTRKQKTGKQENRKLAFVSAGVSWLFLSMLFLKVASISTENSIELQSNI